MWSKCTKTYILIGISKLGIEILSKFLHLVLLIHILKMSLVTALIHHHHGISRLVVTT